MKRQFLAPPDDGGRNSVIVNGRVYSSAPGEAIAVASFDAPVLAANGWISVAGSLLPTTTAQYGSGMVSGLVTNPGGSPAGIAIRVYFDGSSTPAGVTAADAEGAWSVSTAGLGSGLHAFSVEIDANAGSFVVGPTGGAVDFSNPGNSGLLAAIGA